MSVQGVRPPGFLSEVPAPQPGLPFSARTVLRVCLGLLGAQLGLVQVPSLGRASAAGGRSGGARCTA